MKISEIIGKKCESTTGKTGYVLCVTESGGKLDCLVCADANEKEFIIPYGNVISLKQTVIYAEADGAKKSGTPVRLGKPVFDDEGIYLGKLCDLTAENGEIAYAHCGKKKIPADDIICGDAVIVKMRAGVLKSDVKKNGRVIIKRGTYVSGDILEKARAEGEYVQTKLKTL